MESKEKRGIEEGTPKDILVNPKEERTKKFLKRVLPRIISFISEEDIVVYRIKIKGTGLKNVLRETIFPTYLKKER